MTTTAPTPASGNQSRNNTLDVRGFADSVLRGISQVMLQNHPLTGLLFLVGVCWNSWIFGTGALLGGVISTGTAALLGADRTLIRQGLYGFNGVLVAIAVLYFLKPEPLTLGVMVFACALSSILMAAMLAWFEQWRLPVLTAPFVLVSLACFLMTARFGRLETTQLLPMAGLPKVALVEGVVTLNTLLEGLFNGVGQVFFQGNVITGVLFLAGLLVSSRLALTAALTGSLCGALVAWGMGAAEPAIRNGAFGFNGVLTAIALCGVFFRLGGATCLYAGLGVIAVTAVFASVSALLEPFGMPAMTLPFVLVTWVFVMAGRKLKSLPLGE